MASRSGDRGGVGHQFTAPTAGAISGAVQDQPHDAPTAVDLLAACTAARRHRRDGNAVGGEMPRVREVRFFHWLANLDRCWTVDRLEHRNLPHPQRCPLCDQAPETIQHLLPACPFARQDLSAHGGMAIECLSGSDGKEGIAKAANLLCSDFGNCNSHGHKKDDNAFTEADIVCALRAVGCGGPEPDLLLVYGPVRCHLGFPAWRLRYTEIIWPCGTCWPPYNIAAPGTCTSTPISSSSSPRSTGSTASRGCVTTTLASSTCRASVARDLLLECECKHGAGNTLLRVGYGGWMLYTAASVWGAGFVQELLDRDPLLVVRLRRHGGQIG
ncbi:hypothetical protein D1007_02280 [Hordeum vulgare]|nr:hypothetical protein D1007_02280 [Hordeum vulgare]